MQRKAYKIEIAYAVAAFKTEKRNVFFTHKCFKILAWGKNALAPNIVTLVKLGIEYFYSQVRHSYFICIGKTEGKPHVYFVFVLHNAVYLAARVSAPIITPPCATTSTLSVCDLAIVSKQAIKR